MFQFNPGNEDMSGQILGQGVVNAANTTAQANVKLVDDIGGALVGLAGAFGDAGELASQGDSAYEALGAIGEMYPGMKSTYGALGKMDPRTRRMASMSILDNLGSVSQLGIAGMRNTTTQAGQQIDRDRPFIDATLKNLGNTAAGRSTYGTPRGETTVEPDLPVGGDFLPPVRYGAGMQNNVTRFAPSQQSVGAARNWSAGYFGKPNP
jgi:hypothetical protein